jgi:hypothetical protein
MSTTLARLSSVPLLAALSWSAGCQPAASPPAAPAASVPAPVAPPPLLGFEPPPPPAAVETTIRADGGQDSQHPLGLIDEHIHRTATTMAKGIEEAPADLPPPPSAPAEVEALPPGFPTP